MKFITTAKKWGNSTGLVIPSEIKKDLDINEDDQIQVDIVKVNRFIIEEKNIRYRCRGCNTVFECLDNNIFCPNCGLEDNNQITERRLK